MPRKPLGGRPPLGEEQRYGIVCVNHDEHGGGDETTMRPMNGWFAVTLVEPPRLVRPPQQPIHPRLPVWKRQELQRANETPILQQARFVGTSGMPVMCFVCGVCGYVEMYSGLITDTKMWGLGG